MEVAPSRKLTVPVGLPVAPVTVAVKVTVCPAFEGLADETRLVVVEAVVAALLNRYAVMVPLRGLLPVPVMLEVASSPSAAKA
jgi:hypothetical protein